MRVRRDPDPLPRPDAPRANGGARGGSEAARARRVLAIVISGWAHLALLLIGRCEAEPLDRASTETLRAVTLVAAQPASSPREVAVSGAASTRPDPATGSRAQPASGPDAPDAAQQGDPVSQADAVTEGETASEETASGETASDAAVAPSEREAPEPVDENDAPPKPPPDPSFQDFVRTDPATPDAPPVETPEYIGARDTLSESTRRAPVLAREAGPEAPTREGAAASPASAQSSAGGALSAPAPSAPPDPAADVARSSPDPDGAERDAPTPSRDVTEAARDGQADRPANEPPPTVGARGALGAASPPTDAPSVDAIADAAALPEGELPAWWEPGASFVAPSRPPSAPAVPASKPVTPDDAPPSRVAERAERGDDGPPGIVPEPPPSAASPTPHSPEATTDPVDDLRAALGWGAVDRPAAPPSTARSSATPSTPATSSQAVVRDDVEVGHVTRATVGETPLGRYTEGVYAIVQDRWYEEDLDGHLVALGVQGRATVSFLVHRSGRVTDLTLLRSSGHPTLDQGALRAVPTRLPRFPIDLDSTVVRQEITFSYRGATPPEVAP